MPSIQVLPGSLSPSLPPVGTLRFITTAILSVLAFGLCLKGDFYMDDYLHITEAEEVVNGTWHEKNFRALPFLLWSITHSIFGFAPAAFHVWNLVVHTLAACLLIPTVRAFLNTGRWLKDDASRLNAATIAAFIFAVHPLCSEPVNYARCLMIGLVNLFTILAVWASLLALATAGRVRLKFVALALLALLGATFSKTPGAFHAGAAVAITLLAFGNIRPLFSWIRRDTDIIAVTATATIALGKLWPWLTYWAGIARWQLTSPDYAAHVLTQGRVFWAYLARFCWPAGLSSDHRIQQSLSFADRPAALALALAVVLGLVVIACIAYKRTRVPASLAGLGLVHLYLRFLFNNNEFMVEYRIYPGMPWLCALVAISLLPLLRFNRKMGQYSVAALLLACVSTSALRSAIWTDSSALARDTLERYPANNRARGVLMLNLYRAGDYAAVNSLHKEACVVTDALERSNAASRTTNHRIYEPTRLLQDQAAADRMLTLSLAEVKGVDYAIEFANFAIERMVAKRTTTGGRASTRRLENGLVELRDLLVEKGDDYEASK